MASSEGIMDPVAPLAFAALMGLSSLISLSGLLFPRTFDDELQSLWALKRKLSLATDISRGAWESAGESMAKVQQLRESGANPDWIAYLNLDVIKSFDRAKQQYEEALRIRKEVETKIAHMNTTYGEIKTAREAVKDAEECVAQIQSIADEQSKTILQQLRNMGFST